MRGRPYIGGLTRSPVGPPLSPAGGATGPPGACRLLVAPRMGDRGLSPVGGATGPPFFFSDFYFCRDLF